MSPLLIPLHQCVYTVPLKLPPEATGFCLIGEKSLGETVRVCIFPSAARAPLVAQKVKSLPITGRSGFSPRVGKTPREGNGNPLQYFCLEKSHG